MRATLDLETSLLREAEARAAEAGESLTKLSDFRFRPVLRFGATVSGVDLADRDSLYDLMEGRSGATVPPSG